MTSRIKCPGDRNDYVEMTYDQQEGSDGAGSWKTALAIGGTVVGCIVGGTLIHRAIRGHWIWQSSPQTAKKTGSSLLDEEERNPQAEKRVRAFQCNLIQAYRQGMPVLSDEQYNAYVDQIRKST